jgi:hypothetical protein
MHKEKTWVVKRGDIFSLYTRDGKKYMINEKFVVVEATPKGFVLLNDLPEIKKVK